MKKKNKFMPFILLFGIIFLFMFVVSFAVFYTTENFSSTCGCRLPPWIIIVSVSSLGMFSGLGTFYVLSNHFMHEKEKIGENIKRLLDILDKKDKDVLKRLIEEGGEMNQSALSKSLGLDKVTMSRIVSRMQEKNILKKEKNKMTNKLVLNKELKSLFEI